MAKNEAVIHFSGGSDSTLAAALFAERFDRVHLLTYDRFSFIGAKDSTLLNYGRLCKTYGTEKFVRVVVPIGKWHKRIGYERYFHFAKKYKLAVVALMFCKLSMYWYSALYALERGIATVGDGMVPYMDLYPDQNERISLKRLRAFFQAFGIRYENPVYDFSENVEQMLYDRGITDIPRVRGTENDLQVYYAEQVLFALFLKYFVTKHSKAGYERIVGALFDEKIAWMEEKVRNRQGAEEGVFALEIP
jgi:hypothetical protein